MSAAQSLLDFIIVESEVNEKWHKLTDRMKDNKRVSVHPTLSALL